MNNNVRNNYIDKLRGLAILLVVAGHITEYTLGIKGTLFNRVYGNIHVPLFFFISGYFSINNDKYSLFGFFKKKSVQLLLPTIMWGTAWALLGKSITAYWFLPVLFYCLIITRMIQSKFKNQYGILMAGVGLLIIVGLLYWNNFNILPLQLHFIHNYLLFLWGGFYHSYEDTLKSKNWIYTVSLIAFVGIIVLNNHFLNTFKIAGYFVCIVLFRVFEKYGKLIPDFLSKIGKNSMEIYVTHYFFLPNLLMNNKIQIAENIEVYSMDNLLIIATVSILIALLLCEVCVIISKIIKESKILSIVLYGKKGEN